MKVKKAIIPVAGLGTRFLPITKSVPKELLPIVDKPALQYLIEECLESGIEDIYIVNSPLKKEIESYFKTNEPLENYLKERNKEDLLDKIRGLNNYPLHFLEQTKPLGSGDAINQASPYIFDEPVAVLFGDDIVKSEVPFLKQLIEVYEKYSDNVLGIREVPKEQANRYGIAKLEGDRITDIVEKPDIDKAPSNKAVIGRYILRPEIFKELAKIDKNGFEYQITDAINNLRKYQSFYACFLKGEYLDIGSKDGYVKATISYALDRDDIKEDIKEYIDNL